MLMEMCRIMYIPFMYNHVMTIIIETSLCSSDVQLPTVTSLVSSLDLHLHQYKIDALNIILSVHLTYVSLYMYEQAHGNDE